MRRFAHQSTNRACEGTEGAGRAAGYFAGRRRGGLPVVRGIFGANGKRYVSFLYPTGGVAEAQAGGTIPGDYTVRSFDATGVVLSKGKRTYRIPFSMQAPTVPPSQPMGATPYSPISGGPITTVPPMR
ncbi:type IV pilus biogenesis protein PilP [Stenotrophomonas maltophilia]|nr:type IV pilus biogenesis protein PilP [Stenotrophomonas maltophilia]